MRFRIISTAFLVSGMFQSHLQAGKLTGEDAVFFKRDTALDLKNDLTVCIRNSGPKNAPKITQMAVDFPLIAGKLADGKTQMIEALAEFPDITLTNSLLMKINAEVGVADATIEGYGIAGEYSVGGVLSNTSKQLAAEPVTPSATVLLEVDKLVVDATADIATKSLLKILGEVLDAVTDADETVNHDGSQEISTQILNISLDAKTVKEGVDGLINGSANSFGDIKATGGNMQTLNTNAQTKNVDAITNPDVVDLLGTAKNYLELVQNINKLNTNTGFQVKNALGAYKAIGDLTEITSLADFVEALLENYKSA
jgi:hypothetical protein